MHQVHNIWLLWTAKQTIIGGGGKGGADQKEILEVIGRVIEDNLGVMEDESHE